MTKKEIGAILKELRIASNMTQKEVATFLGRKQQIVGHWETGYSQPDANTLFTLCNLYGTSVDAAFGFKKKDVNITKNDMEFLRKYNKLDEHGKEHINSIIEWETERVKALLDKDQVIKDLKKTSNIIDFESARTRICYMKYLQRAAGTGKGMFLFDDIPTDLVAVEDTPLAHRADFVIGLFICTVLLSIVMSATAFAGEWKQDSVGWWFQKDDGDYVKGSLAKIDNYWYYFNDAGYMQTGWLKFSNGWLEFREDGSCSNPTKRLMALSSI